MTANVKRHGTRVVTFRVPEEVYKQLEQVKKATGLSFADLVKLGAKTGDEEVKAKLSEITGLEARLNGLKASLEEEQERLEEFLGEERERRLKDLDIEIEAFKLFDRGWSVEQVSVKLGIAETIAFGYLQEWSDMRKEKTALKREFLKACLKRHIAKLKNSLSWVCMLPSTPEGRAEELERQVADCQRLLASPSKITKQDRDFLLAEYSAAVLSAVRRTVVKSSGKLLEEGVDRL